MKKSINKDMTIGEVFQEFPNKVTKLAQIMTNHGLHCVGCHVAAYETLEQGIMGHGMSEDNLKTLLREMNEVIEKEKE